jgi:outer membrane biosynthesis protein TonB
MTLLTLPTTLPARGERPPLTIRVGGNVQAAQLIRKVSPDYPLNARAMGIQGTVRMTALIGLDGKIRFLHPDSGPAELIPTSVDAVQRWRTRPPRWTASLAMS